MPFVVCASQLLSVPAPTAFDRLVDHESWSSWMPASYRPIGKSVGRLAEGSVFRAQIEGIPFPATCKVCVVRSPSELAWRGGVRGLLWAEHRFLFEPKGPTSVEVVSAETWHGPLAMLLRGVIERGASKIGREQLAALAASVGSPRAC
jgi:hypothetical protein